MARKPARIIVNKTQDKGTSGRSAKMRKEIAGSFRDQARREGGAVRYGKRPSAPAGWNGEVVLTGLTAAEKKDILGMVRHTGATGPRDPDDRVLRVEDRKDGLRILTSESHLAVSIGKRVHRSRKGGTLSITWSPDDVPVRVSWKKG
ncbi:MAG TPA: hypothetical protein VLC10_01080 [Patescibacteria group bacterium]|nr:hypothetical protein [Patescibacteria group bacterium]